MRAECICVGFRTFEKKFFSWAACGFPAHRFPASLPGPLVQVSACVHVGPRREWRGEVGNSRRTEFPLMAPDLLCHHGRPVLALVGLGKVAGAAEPDIWKSSIACPGHTCLWDLAATAGIPDQVEFSWWHFFLDDHVTTSWSIESSVIRAVDLDFHSVLTTNELSDLSEHCCFFLSLFVK